VVLLKGATMAKTGDLTAAQVTIVLNAINTQYEVFTRAIRATPDPELKAVYQKRTAELLAVRDHFQGSLV